MLRFWLLIFVVYPLSIVFGQKAITVEDFSYKDTFQAKTITGINWTQDGKYYTTLQDNRIIKYNVTTGAEVDTLVDGNSFTEKVEINDYSFSNDESMLLLITNKSQIYRRSFSADYLLYDLKRKSVQKLSEGGKQSYATFSPDDSKIAFVRANNLFYVSLATMEEVQVTSDGKSNYIVNGTSDWVYEEEFSLIVGFCWSPDSKKLAYHRFDESEVKEYNMQMWNRKTYPSDYRFKYPKAGEKNSMVQVWVYNVESKSKIKADIGEDADCYVPRVSWTRDANLLAVRKMNRLQNELLLLHIDANTGKSKVIVQDKSEAYIDIRWVDELIYLSDGKRFIKSNESRGFKHLFLYSMDGQLLNQITSGNFEIMNVHGVNEKVGVVYYTSSEVSPLERHFYYISLDGKIKEKLTKEKGQHWINMSPDFQFYVDHFSSSKIPPTATLYQVKGNSPVKVLEKNQTLAKTVTEYKLAPKEFFTFKSNDGIALNGYFLKPQNMIAGKKYPLLLYQYSGPGSQNSGEVWAGNHYYFHQLLTQKGYIVAVIDPRGTGARGAHFKKMTYKRLGKLELEDIVSAGKYFSTLPFVDKTRMGIWGWSYGGYMTLLALIKGNNMFTTGIAIAPVTSWRFYNTVYTDRFLQSPQLNPAGYDDLAPYLNASDLSGNLLMIHGTGDDNVHFQHSVAMEDALIHAGKQFRSFYYPDKNHGILGPKTRTHLYTQMLDFVLEKL